MTKTIKYSSVGDNYATKDPIKVLAQSSAKSTSINLSTNKFAEVSETRGESAFVWKQGNIYMASVIEGLGTKNLIADEMRKITGKTYYDAIAHDTVATIINDLISVGASPLVIHAYWAIENNEWLADQERMKDLITGWKKACDTAKVTWGGGETPTLRGVLVKNSAELAGSAVGIISKTKRLILGKKLKAGDQIILIKSTGMNANGSSLVRAVAKKLKNGYATKLPSGKMFGDAVLVKSNIYSQLIQNLLDNKIDLHYVSNITGHGLRKIMRAQESFTYVIDSIVKPLELFDFIKKEANLSDYEIYGTFNMGMDYALYLSEKDVRETLEIIKKCGFKGFVAGRVEKGGKKVIIKPLNIVYEEETLGVR